MLDKIQNNITDEPLARAWWIAHNIQPHTWRSHCPTCNIQNKMCVFTDCETVTVEVLQNLGIIMAKRKKRIYFLLVVLLLGETEASLRGSITRQVETV